MASMFLNEHYNLKRCFLQKERGIQEKEILV